MHQQSKQSQNDRRHIAFDRRLKVDTTADEHDKEFASNIVVSSKYNVWTFLPLMLYAQLKRPSNLYFLFIAFLQSYEDISNTNGVPTILLPLSIVFLFSALKEALEDRERHRADQVTNRKPVDKLSANQSWVSTCWGKIKVGDIIRVYQDQVIPADLIILNVEGKKDPQAESILTSVQDESNDDQSNDLLAYVETKSLDGETNFKLRAAHPSLYKLCTESRDTLSRVWGEIECDAPNDRINMFHSSMTINVQEDTARQLQLEPGPEASITHIPGAVQLQLSLNFRQTLLRSCVLRNTHSIVGMVVYTGHETKVFCSNKNPQVKVSSVEEKLNTLIIFIVCIQQAVCFLGAILGAHWIARHGDRHWYLHTTNTIGEGSPPLLLELLKLHLRYFIIMQNFVPISLNVSLEFVKYWQAYFMQQDLEMYDKDSDTPAVIRSSALNEDLGRVHHIFTDKTGTLTRNLMVFRYCWIYGKHYGGDLDSLSIEQEPDSDLKCEFVQFNPQELLTDLSRNDRQSETIRLFLRHLALCHTLLPTKSFEETCASTFPIYSASSPDEQALASAAAFCNVRFIHRSLTSMVLMEPGYAQLRIYKLLLKLDFDSERKRMSVIVESPEKEIFLLCKGADSVIFERLSDSDSAEEKESAYRQLSQYAKSGMRTLCIAWKQLEHAQFEDWHARYTSASASQQKEDVAVLVEEMEKDLMLLGVTAVQDKLQEGVSHTLQLFRQMDIKIWTLTGDKVETAINIAYASSLLTHEMSVKQITTETYAATAKILNAIAAQYEKPQCLHNRTPINRSLHFQLQRHGFWRYVKRKLQKLLLNPYKNERKRSLSSERLTNVPQHDSDSPFSETEPLTRTSSTRQPQLAIVIDGKALDFALSPRLEPLFFSVAEKSAAIICCRVSPKQKADIVELVRSMKPEIVTLAIGDGANDVGMIQAAHIGIGISGKEGTQAVNASDYSIAQFRFLQRLLCVHGRWAYRRVTKLMCYMLYKNVTYVLTTFWFGFVSGFSGQPLILDVAAQSFNVLYTSLPLILFAVFDQDVSSKSACKVPYLYALGQRNTLLRRRVFWPWILNGTWHSILIFFLSVVTFYGTRWICSNISCTNASSTDPNGKLEGLDTLGLVVFTNLVIVVNLKLCLETFLITWPFVISVLYSIVAWFLIGNLIALPRIGIHHAIGELPYLQRLVSFWLLLILAAFISLFRDGIWKITRRQAYPSTYHILQEREMLNLTTSPRHFIPPTAFSTELNEGLDDLLYDSSSLSERLIVPHTIDTHLRARGIGGSLDDEFDKLHASKSFDIGYYFRHGKADYLGYAFSEDENAGTEAEDASMSTSRLGRRHERSLSSRNANRRSLKYILKSLRGTKNA